MVKPQNVKAREKEKLVTLWAKKTHKDQKHAIVQNYLKVSHQTVRRSANIIQPQCNVTKHLCMLVDNMI